MTRRIIVNREGWLVDYETHAWIQLPDHPNFDIHTDSKGWPYIPLDPAAPLLPEAPAAHVKRDNAAGDWGWYSTNYPTHHEWDPDVEELVLKYESEFDSIYLNTYYMHPPIFGTRDYEFRSFDVWDVGGRGQALASSVGSAVFDRIFNDAEGPSIAWIIHSGWMWTSAAGWEVYNPPEDGSDPGHWRHIHVTYHP